MRQWGGRRNPFPVGASRCDDLVMSTAKPFMPAGEPSAAADPTEHDIDTDVDILDSTGDDAATTGVGGSAEARPVREGNEAPPFRTPTPGARLTAEQLEADLRHTDDR
jgi:hypothetical protein